METIETLLEEYNEEVERNVDTIKHIILRAYHIGREEGFTEGQNNILENRN